MSGSLDLTPEIDAELSRRLAAWADVRRLGELEAATIRAHVLVSEAGLAEAGVDVDWLWSLLRPVTDLVEMELPNVIERWLEPLGAASTYQPYLRLA